MQLDQWRIESVEMEIKVMVSSYKNISLRRECKKGMMGNKIN